MSEKSNKCHKIFINLILILLTICIFIVSYNVIKSLNFINVFLTIFMYGATVVYFFEIYIPYMNSCDKKRKKK